MTTPRVLTSSISNTLTNESGPSVYISAYKTLAGEQTIAKVSIAVVLQPNTTIVVDSTERMSNVTWININIIDSTETNPYQVINMDLDVNVEQTASVAAYVQDLSTPPPGTVGAPTKQATSVSIRYADMMAR